MLITAARHARRGKPQGGALGCAFHTLFLLPKALPTVWVTADQRSDRLVSARCVELREVSPRPGRTTVALGLRAFLELLTPCGRR